ncbi:hypothetical protein [Thiolapillus brandeum]|nr:hypothetical protein [Thiolapillus brandeum]
MSAANCTTDGDGRRSLARFVMLNAPYGFAFVKKALFVHLEGC